MTFENASETLTMLRNAGRIAIATHTKPDGDAIGSALGLCHLLRNAGKHASVLDLGPLPARYAYLGQPDLCLSSSTVSPESFDLLVVLDAATIERTPTFASEWAADLPLLNIDHHISNTQFGTTRLIEPNASSTSEMVARIAIQAGLPFSLPAAEALWVGIVTDTGRFAYSCTSATTLQTAAKLLEFPVKTAEIDHALYQAASLKRLRLEGRAIDSLHTRHNGKLAYISISRDDFAQLDCHPIDADELVNLPRRCATAEAALFFYELLDEQATKVSVRTSPPHDASALCAHFGGGGHVRAAGCTIAEPLAQAMRVFLDKIHSECFPNDTP
jgi:phosphoesterase RecJ-like protein